jgi:hypothetical protein
MLSESVPMARLSSESLVVVVFVVAVCPRKSTVAAQMATTARRTTTPVVYVKPLRRLMLRLVRVVLRKGDKTALRRSREAVL